jgi:FAD binding domain
MYTEENAVRAPHRFDDLRRVVAGGVHVPGDAGWDEARRPWNVAVEQTPLAVVEVADAEDVRHAVRWAVDNDRQVTAQPVGHGARDDLDQVLLLRTRALNGIEIDLGARTATIGAGGKAGELLAALSGTGLTFLVGSSTDPTVAGMTLGGGMSWFGRRYGQAANAIEAVELVDGMGRAREVTRASDPELFWALRGGGGDFGIVTSLRIRLFPAREIYGGQLMWPVDRLPAVLTAFRAITADAPEKLTLWLHRMQFPPLPELPEVLRGHAFVTVALTHLGPAAEAESLIAPLRLIPGPVLGQLGPVPLRDLGQVAAEPADPMPSMQHSFLLNDIGEDVIDGICELAGPDSGSPLTMIKVMHLGGAFRQAGESAAACGEITEPYLLFALGIPDGPDAAAGIAAAFGQLETRLRDHASGRTVPNFMGAGNGLDQIWPAGVREKLAEIKRRVDPVHTIRSNRPVL